MANKTETELDLRALDAEVAERVMGECAHVLAEDMDTAHRKFKCGKCGQRGFDFQTDYEGRVLVSRYSTDIAAAMQVVKQMQERGYRVFIRDYEGVVTWEVKFASVKGPSYEASGNELAEVICRAALAAINEEAK